MSNGYVSVSLFIVNMTSKAATNAARAWDHWSSVVFATKRIFKALYFLFFFLFFNDVLIRAYLDLVLFKF